MDMISVKAQMKNAGYNFDVMTVRGKHGIKDRPETQKEHSCRIKAVEKIINKMIFNTAAYTHIFDDLILNKPESVNKTYYRLCEELIGANLRKIREELGILARS